MPQVLRLMVDLEEEDDWAIQDEVEDDDSDRFVLMNIIAEIQIGPKSYSSKGLVSEKCY